MRDPLPQGMTPEQFVDRWRTAAKTLWQGILDRDHPPSKTWAGRWDNGQGIRGSASTHVRRTSQEMKVARDYRWRKPGAVATIAATLTPAQKTMWYGNGTLLRAVRLAHAMAASEPFAVTPEGAQALRRIFGASRQFRAALELMSVRAHSDDLPMIAPPAPGHVLTIEAAFAFRTPAGNGLLSTAMARSSTTLAIQGVDGVAAPELMRLKTPDGGWLPIREVNGIPYRPLLAPGRWQPVQFAECAAALRDGRAWMDHPGLENFHVGRFLDLEDLAAEEAPPKSHSARAEAEKKIRLACSGLVCIDGIVYRPTTQPEIGLRESTPIDVFKSVHTAWRVDSLLSDTQQDPLSPHKTKDTEFMCLYDPNFEDGKRRLVWPIKFEELARRSAAGWREVTGFPPEPEGPIAEGIKPAAPVAMASHAIRLLNSLPNGAERPHKFTGTVRDPIDRLKAINPDREDPTELARLMESIASQVRRRSNRMLVTRENKIHWANPEDFLAMGMLKASAAILQDTARKPDADEDFDAIAEGFAP